MKKIIIFTLTIMLILSICSCGNSGTQTSTTTAAVTTEASAQDQLSELENKLFKALIKMTKDHFYNPSTVRVLEIGSHFDRTTYDKNTTLYGPETVVVRLQGDNRAGGTLNHYYKVCITAAENTSADGKASIKDRAILGWDDLLLDLKGEVGDYAELEDSTKVYSSNRFDVGKINKALKEYWDDMGF